MSRLILTFIIILVGLGLGYGIRRHVLAGTSTDPIVLNRWRKRLQQVALLAVLPMTMLGAVWTVDFRSAAVFALPAIGVLAIMSGGVLAFGAARILRLSARQAGAFVPCGSFTNIGAIGALVCFMLLGESGFALVPIYKLFEETVYYGIGFPVAKYFSTVDAYPNTGRKPLRALTTDPYILAALSAIAIGGTLNVAGIARPSAFATFNAFGIPLGTSLLLISIGMAMQFGKIAAYIRPCMAVVAIKFAMVPAIAVTAAWMAGLRDVDNGLPMKVVLILSAMPVAFNALIPPSLYDLDLDLANACWLVTTAALVVVLPVLAVALIFI